MADFIGLLIFLAVAGGAGYFIYLKKFKNKD